MSRISDAFEDLTVVLLPFVGFAGLGFMLISMMLSSTVPTEQEVWSVRESLPVVALDDVQGVYISGGVFSVDGHDTVAYTYAYETDRGSIRQGTTTTLGTSGDPLPVEVFDDAKPGEARIDVMVCRAKEDRDNSVFLNFLRAFSRDRCAEPKRIEIHVPQDSVRLGVAVDGPVRVAERE